ncbi:MAG: cytochrome c maturation protein CcmE [bacterium]|nr:cytochrome c maturation protein CcmE [bacterium]
MNRRHVLIPAGALLAIVVGFLVWGGITDNVVYYLTPSEAVDQRSGQEPGYRFRLGGLVEADWLHGTDDGVRFMVGDGAVSIAVEHAGAVPQLFRPGIGVVVEGAWEGETFRSDTLLINHDEQYRAVDGEGTYQVPTAGP